MNNHNPIEFDARLESVPLDDLNTSPPETILAFMTDANAQVDTLIAAGDAALAEFVPGNARLVYEGLAQICDRSLAPGNLFCEWGSGIGVVSCLAQSLGFAAHGVEIHDQLVVQARELATTHKLAAQFYAGSYKPAGAYSGVYDAPPVCAALGFDPFSVDIVYAYPWPAEEHVVLGLFAALAPVGALLLTYHGGTTMRLCRKVSA